MGFDGVHGVWGVGLGKEGGHFLKGGSYPKRAPTLWPIWGYVGILNNYHVIESQVWGSKAFNFHILLKTQTMIPRSY